MGLYKGGRGTVNRRQLYKIRQHYFEKWEYKMCYWDKFKFERLSNIMYVKRAGRNDNDTYNDCIIMFDTETSKKDPAVIGENHVVAFTVSINLTLSAKTFSFVIPSFSILIQTMCLLCVK